VCFKENNRRLRFLSEEEIQRFRAECPKHLRRIVDCAIHTGMRRGEILSLTRAQIRHGQIYLHKTKIDEARHVPINPDLDQLFKEIRRGQELRSEQVFTFWNGEHNVKGERPVGSRRSTPESPRAIASINTAFTAACRRAGIEDFRFHDLRHTFASHMVMRGASLNEVQEILGHHSLTMTTRYAHLSQEQKKERSISSTD
jgi:integrase